MRILSLRRALPLGLIALFFSLGVSLRAQNLVGDFECQAPANSVGFPAPDCDDWADESTAIFGLSDVGTVSSSCPGMPTRGNQFLSIAAFPILGGPSIPIVPSGSSQAAWPFTGGNVSVLTKTTPATSASIGFDYVLLRDSLAPNYFLQVLVVDPLTDQVITPILLTETSGQTFTPSACPAPNAGATGGPLLDATAVQFAAAVLPPIWVGQNVKLTIALGQTDGGSIPGSGQFIEAAALIDNLRFSPAPPTSDELRLGGADLVFGAGGTVTATGTVTAFKNGQGGLVTDPNQDAVIGATFTLAGNLSAGGPDLSGGVLTVTSIDLVAAPGVDELGFIGQYVNDPLRDRFRLAGLPAVLPSAFRALTSAIVTTPVRVGSGSSVLDGLENALGVQNRELGLIVDLVPGQAPRIDRLVLDYQPAPPTPEFNFDTDGAGSIVLGVAGVEPTDELFNVFVTNPTVPLGQGAFFGLEFTPLVADTLASPLGTVPFHVSPDADGAFFWGLPAGALPAGLVLDGAAGTVDPLTGSPTWISPVVRRAF